MFKQHSMLWAALAAAGIVGAVGCQSTGTDSMANEERPNADNGSLRVAAEPERPAPVAALEAVYFDFDRWELSEDARKVLKSSAEQIRTQPEWGILTIEGHCDKRGSDDYNLALGDRRAAAVKRYLVDLGVPSSRFDEVTYGESRPAVRGEGESVWRRNRRAEIRVEVHQASG